MPQTTTYRNALPLATALQEYRLDGVLGAGAFGMTYLAWDTHLEKKVAIKEYLPTDVAVRALDGSVLPVSTDHGHDYKWGLDRFLLEARTLARFSHPNIVRVNRYFEANGTAYVVMDYEQGDSLAQVLRAISAPDEGMLLKLLVPLLDGLQAVHEAGFLHRDIKPANVFLRDGGMPVLLDFGAARQALGGATKSLTSVLTPGYAPLEQYSSDGNQGPWTDIYALGGVLYRALVNENPPDATSRVRNDVVPTKLQALRGRVGVALLNAVEWAMAMNERERPQSVREWRDAIQGRSSPAVGTLAPARASTGVIKAAHTVAPKAGPTLPPTAPGTLAAARRRPKPPEERRPLPLGWAAVAVALLAAFIGFRGWGGHDRPPAVVARQPEPVFRASAPEYPRPEPVIEHAQPEPAYETPAAVADRPPFAVEHAVAARGEPQFRAPQAVPAAPDRPPRDRIDRPGDESSQFDQLRKQAVRDFLSADADRDGYLSREEAQRFPSLARGFGRVDTDGDGRISPHEFTLMRRVMAQQRFQK